MRLLLNNFFLALCIFSFTLSSCEKEYESVEELDERNIQAYIRANNLSVQKLDTTGVYYQIIKPGTGAPVSYAEKIPIIFTIRSLDGQFASVDTFSVNNRYGGFFGYLREGLREGVRKGLVNRGGQVRLIVPSRLAFGRNGDEANGIPSNASLDYVVTVLDNTKLVDYEDQTIQKYLQANNLTGFTKATEGYYYKIASAGTGSPITVDSTLTTKYTGRFLNGKIFETNEAMQSALSGLVRGWQLALPMIKEGGSMRIVIPSSLAYGIEGTTSIPAFSPLDFDISVTKVDSAN